ncbi:MAG TPA: ADOP family duplicated permease [Vicinamibacterales bacterium]|nr:ADOP family duplicated permease [Vicinamibacterales bacterium]
MKLELLYAWRRLRHAPGFSLVTLLTLSLGLASTVTMFAAVNAAFLQPLPFPDEHALVKVYEAAPRSQEIRVPLPVLRDWEARRPQAFSAVAGYLSGARINVASGQNAERASLSRVTRPFFDVMGVAPIRGRTFNASETTEGGPPVAVISYRLWQQLLHGREDVLSAGLEIDRLPVAIIGVMPEGFAFPDETDLWATVDREAPTAYGTSTAHNFYVVGRLQRGATPASARSELLALMAEQERSDALMAKEHMDIAISLLRTDLLGPQASLVLIGLGAVLCLLLVCCVNVANLMLARSVSREVETGIRLALGSSRAAIARSVIVEGMLLAGASAIIGLAAGRLATDLVSALTPVSVTGGVPLGLDWRVVALTLTATTLVGVLSALLPAWRSTRVDTRQTLASGGRSLAAAPRRAMNVLVGVEVALAFMLLFGAGLLARSDARLERVDLGFRTSGLVLSNVALGFLPNSPYGTPEPRRAFFERLESSLAASPGINRVGLAAIMPLGFSPNGRFVVEGREKIDQAHFRLVGGDYFRTLQIPVRSGRAFTKDDDAGHPQVAVINEALARQSFPGQDPIGQIVSMPGMDGGTGTATIVGIVADIRHEGPSKPVDPEAYFSYRQRPWRTYSMTLIVDSSLSNVATVALVRDRVRAIDPLLPPEFQTMDARVADVTAPARFRASLLGSLALITLALAVVGILGVVAYGTARRTRELGIRIALGATPLAVTRLVVVGGLLPVAAGMLAGALGALTLGRVLQAFLFEVETSDPLTLAGVALALVAAGLVGSCWPALRAARIAPTAALRE